MALIGRTYECGFGHRWDKIVDRNDPAPEECPLCNAILAAQEFTGSNNPPPEIIEVPGAPAIRSNRAKAVQRFEDHAFKRVNCDDERILLGNLKDNVREGESYAVPETASTNDTLRFMKDQADYAAANPGEIAKRQTEGAHLMTLGGGWQGPGGMAPVLQQTASQPAPIARPMVDLQSKRAAPKAKAK